MNAGPNSTMREAMRLMRAGELLAATAAIQHRLGGATGTWPAQAARPPDRSPIEGAFRVVDETPEARSRFGEHTYAGSAGTRRYKLFIPSAYRGQPLPLIVMLHGCTQTPDDFATGTRMNMLAQERGCLVVYPAQSACAHASKCWNWFKTSDPCTRVKPKPPTLRYGSILATRNPRPLMLRFAGSLLVR